jgi:RNA polymerase sigma factor (sigma-70 family)
MLDGRNLSSCAGAQNQIIRVENRTDGSFSSQSPRLEREVLQEAKTETASGLPVHICELQKARLAGFRVTHYGCNSWTERIPDPQPDPEMVYKEEETRKLIDALLAKINPILQQAFAMTYYEDMSNEEAGASLGIAAGRLKSRLFRARQHLMAQAQLLGAPVPTATHSQPLPRKVTLGQLVPPADNIVFRNRVLLTELSAAPCPFKGARCR